jgi:Family of unknown function (DUF6064)
MSEWWSYTLSDLLMFSADSYRRMFELHHRAWWPLQLATAALGLWLVAHCLRPQPRRARALSFAFAAVWAFVAWGFFATRYAQINLAAPYFAWAATAQSLLLACLGAMPAGAAVGIPKNRMVAEASPRTSLRYGAWPAVCLAAYALIGFPLIGIVYGRDWRESEWLGLTPDATALATLALLATMRSRARWLAVPVPMLSTIAGIATLQMLRSVEAWALGAGLLLAMLALVAGPSSGREAGKAAT